MKRLFIAADLSIQTRKAIAAATETLRAVGGGLNFVPAENLHVTLEFLGNVEIKILPLICHAVEKTVAGFGPFEFEMQNILRMPPDKTVRMIWAKVGNGADIVEKLVGRIISATAPLGFLPEARPFRPHVTICRVNSISRDDEVRLDDAIKEIADRHLGKTTLRDVMVYESILGKPASKYVPLKKCKL